MMDAKEREILLKDIEILEGVVNQLKSRLAHKSVDSLIDRILDELGE